MKKRLLSLILALCIIISFSPSTLAANLPEVDVRTEGLTPAQPQEAPAEKPRDAGAERRTIYVSNEGTEEEMCIRDSLGSVVNLSLSDLCTALQDGNIDAFLYATPAPGTNFTDLAMSFGIKVVDIGQEAVDKLMAEKPWYHTVVIPAGTYDGCDEDITTFAQYTCLLYTSRCV